MPPSVLTSELTERSPHDTEPAARKDQVWSTRASTWCVPSWTTVGTMPPETAQPPGRLPVTPLTVPVTEPTVPVTEPTVPVAPETVPVAPATVPVMLQAVPV